MPREVTGSFWPWFYHRRMLPKWTGLAVTMTVAATWWTPAFWWLWPIGFVMFFPIEYTVHRWVYHGLVERRIGTVLSKQHVAHHDAPQDLDFLFNDPRFGIVTGSLLFLVYWLVSGSLGVAGSLTAGNFGGFLYYEWVHLAAHRPGVRPLTPWNRALKRTHLWHHFKHERYWYGVTSSVFDHAFGSYRHADAVTRSPTVRTLVAPEEHEAWMKDVRPPRRPHRRRGDDASVESA